MTNTTATYKRPQPVDMEGMRSGRRMVTVRLENEEAPRVYRDAYYTLLFAWLKVTWDHGDQEIMWPVDRVIDVQAKREDPRGKGHEANIRQE